MRGATRDDGPEAGPSGGRAEARALGSPRSSRAEEADEATRALIADLLARDAEERRDVPRRRRHRGRSPPPRGPGPAEGGRQVQFFFPDTARDEHLPLAAVELVMRRALPAGARVSAGAKAAVQENATAFIRAVTAEAYDRAVRRGTAEARGVTGEDVVFAVAGLGFASMAAEVPERESPGRFSRVRYHVSPRVRGRLTLPARAPAPTETETGRRPLSPPPADAGAPEGAARPAPAGDRRGDCRRRPGAAVPERRPARVLKP